MSLQRYSDNNLCYLQYEEIIRNWFDYNNNHNSL